jgi:hypothetical protein
MQSHFDLIETDLFTSCIFELIDGLKEKFLSANGFVVHIMRVNDGVIDDQRLNRVSILLCKRSMRQSSTVVHADDMDLI